MKPTSSRKIEQTFYSQVTLPMKNLILKAWLWILPQFNTEVQFQVWADLVS